MQGANTEKSICRDAEQHVDLVVDEAAAELIRQPARESKSSIPELVQDCCAYVFRGPVMGSPTDAYPLTCTNGGPVRDVETAGCNRNPGLPDVV